MSAKTAFEYLNKLTGLAPLALPQFDGGEAQLPTPLCAATAAAAALGLGASAAAEIWRLRGGESQSIAVNLAAAAATLQAGLPSPFRDHPLTGFYHSADRRWLFLHGGFDGASKLTDLLNADNEAGAILEGVSRWNGQALENAIVFMGLCGALEHTETEWRASVQGRALLAASPIMLRKIGDAPPLRLPASRLPLDGIRTLDPTAALAGPLCGQLLASYGADVLAIRHPRFENPSPFGLAGGAGKRTAMLDLTKPADAETLRRLARRADVFIDSWRPGALAKLGFTPAALAQLSPGIVHVTISAYGSEGPWSKRRGWEQDVQVASGLAAEQGAFAGAKNRRHDSQPELIGGHPCSVLAGQLAAAGALAALIRRIREGGSWRVSVSLAGAAIWLQSLGRLDAAMVPVEWRPDGLDPYYRTCETTDGVTPILGPVVRMAKTAPLWSAPRLIGQEEEARWSEAREEVHAAQKQPA
jgi:crotonobetainyl-CoA:carnitine CoA-transferase CaiB-like acyl-CoA transferase